MGRWDELWEDVGVEHDDRCQGERTSEDEAEDGELIRIIFPGVLAIL